MRSASPGDETGSAVAEFAVALPAVVLVLVTVLAGLQIAGLQVRAQDAAADAARAFARGDGSPAIARRLDWQVAGAALSRWDADDLVCVRVSVAPAGPARLLGIRPQASSCALAGGG